MNMTRSTKFNKSVKYLTRAPVAEERTGGILHRSDALFVVAVRVADTTEYATHYEEFISVAKNILWLSL